MLGSGSGSGSGGGGEGEDGVHCARCGAVPPSVPPPVGWSGGTERGRPHWLCGDCVRAHLRSVEAKLDETWW